MKICSVFILVSGFLATATISSKPSQKYRGWLDVFNFGNQPQEYTPPPGFQPCYLPTTTTPQPLVGPLCPIYPPEGQVSPTPSELIRPPVQPNVLIPENVPPAPVRLPVVVGLGNYQPPVTQRPIALPPPQYPRPNCPPNQPEILVSGPGNMYPPEYPRPIGGHVVGGQGQGIGQGGPFLLPSPSEPRPVQEPVRCGQVCPVGGMQFPYVPQGFSYANPHLIPPQQGCPLVPRPDVPLCSTLEMLDKLQLRIMYNYIVKAGLEQLFQLTSNYTFFVPADPAFVSLPEWFRVSLDNDVKLLRAFVLNHFVKMDIPLENFGNEFLILNARPGGNRLRSNIYFPEVSYRTYTLDGSQIVLGDIFTSSGRLHILNKVIVPNPPRNAAQYLQEVPEFSNFMSAVVSANLLDVLQSSEPITLFIPSNEAFNSFDLNTLQKNVTSLRNFVNYHIVRGTYYSNGLLNGQYLTTLFDKEIRLSVTFDGFKKSLAVVNNVNDVLKSDITLLNGAAHVISGVLSRVPDFYIYEQVNEFQELNFDSLKRNFDLNNHLKEGPERFYYKSS